MLTPVAPSSLVLPSDPIPFAGVGRKRGSNVDFFAVFPQLRQAETPYLAGRSLRLLSLAALAYDETNYYFELSDERYWVRASDEQTTIGVGGAQTRLTQGQEPLPTLFRYLREAWHSEPEYVPQRHLYLLEGEEAVVLDVGAFLQPATPQLLVLTPPRLGGAEMPDALVQAIYFVRLRTEPYPSGAPGMLQVERERMERFLAEDRWPIVELLAQPWASLLGAISLPREAYVQPVLALRALRRLWREGLFPIVTTGGNA